MTRQRHSPLMFKKPKGEGPCYLILQCLSRIAIWSYFRHLKVICRAPVPLRGPVVVASNHTNMVIDPAMLIATFPYGRACHFWALARFFKVPLVGQLLLAGGVLPVDTHTRSNDKLFENTLACLEKGGVIALFPEGTSYTRPDHLPFKDGLSWATFEYLEQQKSKHEQDMYLPIIPVGITYTTKNKWRSDVVVEYGEPIIVGPSDLEKYQKDSKNAVKELTERIVEGVEKGTVNASDWDTIHAASEARFLLFGDTTDAHLEKYVQVLQSLIHLFDTDILDDNCNQEPLIKERKELKKQLVICAEDLKRMKLSALDIRRYDNNSCNTNNITQTEISVQLISAIISLIFQLPLILPGLLIHAPLYILGHGINYFEAYTESVAQNKVVASMTLAVPLYMIVFYFMWQWMNYTLVGACIGVVVVPLIAWYHINLVDKRYDLVKNVVTLVRVFMAVSGLDDDRHDLELVINRRTWCFHRVKSVIAQLANSGNPHARFLVHLGQDVFPKYVAADTGSDDGDDLTCL
ncbi:unnamed protein product [Absidia cylindrospora]